MNTNVEKLFVQVSAKMRAVGCVTSIKTEEDGTTYFMISTFDEVKGMQDPLVVLKHEEALGKVTQYIREDAKDLLGPQIAQLAEGLMEGAVEEITAAVEEENQVVVPTFSREELAETYAELLTSLMERARQAADMIATRKESIKKSGMMATLTQLLGLFDVIVEDLIAPADPTSNAKLNEYVHLTTQWSAVIDEAEAYAVSDEDDDNGEPVVSEVPTPPTAPAATEDQPKEEVAEEGEDKSESTENPVGEGDQVDNTNVGDVVEQPVAQVEQPTAPTQEAEPEVAKAFTKLEELARRAQQIKQQNTQKSTEEKGEKVADATLDPATTAEKLKNLGKVISNKPQAEQKEDEKQGEQLLNEAKAALAEPSALERLKEKVVQVGSKTATSDPESITSATAALLEGIEKTIVLKTMQSNNRPSDADLKKHFNLNEKRARQTWNSQAGTAKGQLIKVRRKLDAVKQSLDLNAIKELEKEVNSIVIFSTLKS